MVSLTTRQVQALPLEARERNDTWSRVASEGLPEQEPTLKETVRASISKRTGNVHARLQHVPLSNSVRANNQLPIRATQLARVTAHSYPQALY